MNNAPAGPSRQNWRTLVGHREFAHATDSLEAVQAKFAAGRQDFMAVLDGRLLVGLCSRRDLGTLLGARYGFALHARKPVSEHLVPDAIRIGADDPLPEVLQAISARRNEHFYDDVLLVDAGGDFLGLLHVRDLVRLQTNMLMGNLAEIADKNRQMEDDLRMAREVQVAMLPRDFPAGSGLGFAHLYEPAGGVGGDFFDVMPLGSGAAGIIVCDVMGHGVRSALITAMVRTMLEELRPLAAEPGRMLTELNAHLSRLLRRTGDMIFVTAAYGVIDAAAKRLVYAQAGHPTPLHWAAQSGLAAPLSGAEGVAGPALGLVDGADYPELVRPLAVRDRLLFFTDGVFEVVNGEGEEFGMTRLAASLAQSAGERLAAVPAAVRASAAGFAGGQPFGDDVCLVACELER